MNLWLSSFWRHKKWAAYIFLTNIVIFTLSLFATRNLIIERIFSSNTNGELMLVWTPALLFWIGSSIFLLGKVSFDELYFFQRKTKDLKMADKIVVVKKALLTLGKLKTKELTVESHFFHEAGHYSTDGFIVTREKNNFTIKVTREKELFELIVTRGGEIVSSGKKGFSQLTT